MREVIDIAAWIGAGILSAAFIAWSAAFFISLIRESFGRYLIIAGGLLILTLWGVLSVLWLIATKVV